MQFQFNISSSNITEHIASELRIRFNAHELESLSLLIDLSSHDLDIRKMKYRKKASDAMSFVAIAIKYRYDHTYKSLIMKLEDMIFFKLYHEYHLLEHNLLDQSKTKLIN